VDALEFLNVLAQAIYVVIFVAVVLRAVRHPTPAHADMTLFFGIITFVVLAGRIGALFGTPPPAWVGTSELVVIMALPYALLRLVRDFTTVRPGLVLAVETGFVISAAAAIAFGAGLPAPVLFAMVAFFAAVSLYCAVRFVRAGRASQGVTRRRLESVSVGSVLIGATLLLAGLEAFTPPGVDAVLNALTRLFALGSGIAYYLGFAPPQVLKSAWQAPELNAFLARASQLPRLPTTTAIVRELERSAAGATGAYATIGLWDEDSGSLSFLRAEPSTDVVHVLPGQLAGGRAFASGNVEFSADPIRDHPEGAEIYRATGVGAAIAAPITAGDKRLGVLCIFAPRPPFFAVSDMELAKLLAAQAAVILEARALIDHASRVQAREEATRLKEDFLSAAAHDLRTPLTTVVAQAQFLERRSLRDPSAPPDIRGLQRIAREAERLATLVTDLLDVARLEQHRLVGEREPVDLVAVAGEVAQRHDGALHPVRVEVRDPVVGSFDRRRIEQLMENLVENATKYSEGRAPVVIEVGHEADTAHITVRDHGIGIPAADLTRIFDRFSRASNVDDRRFHGMGLGLYICRGIAEEHGGRIWAESEVGQGSTFHVELPLGGNGRLN
jgi:signal transduction histidine kinase